MSGSTSMLLKASTGKATAGDNCIAVLLSDCLVADHAFEPEEPQEIIAETQNDEDALVTAGSQVSNYKMHL